MPVWRSSGINPVLRFNESYVLGRGYRANTVSTPRRFQRPCHLFGLRDVHVIVLLTVNKQRPVSVPASHIRTATTAQSNRSCPGKAAKLCMDQI